MPGGEAFRGEAVLRMDWHTAARQHSKRAEKRPIWQLCHALHVVDFAIERQNEERVQFEHDQNIIQLDMYIYTYI